MIEKNDDTDIFWGYDDGLVFISLLYQCVKQSPSHNYQYLSVAL